MAGTAADFESHIIDIESNSNWKLLMDAQTTGNLAIKSVQKYRDFENYMKEKDIVPKSREKYMTDYFTLMHTPKETDDENSTVNEMEKPSGFKIATIHQRFSFIKTYFDHMVRLDISKHLKFLYARMKQWRDPENVKQANVFGPNDLKTYISIIPSFFYCFNIHKGSLQYHNCLRVNYW